MHLQLRVMKTLARKATLSEMLPPLPFGVYSKRNKKISEVAKFSLLEKTLFFIRVSLYKKANKMSQKL